MGRVRQLTRRLKSFDSALYCAENKEGKLCVYRNSTRWEDVWIDARLMGQSEPYDVLLKVAHPSPFYIFTLTHDWRPTGRSVEWSWDKIYYQLQKHDGWNRDLMADIDKQEEESKRSAARQARSKAEDFASEFRPSFQKAFSDINTSSMAKIDKRKLDEEKYGNN